MEVSHGIFNGRTHLKFTAAGMKDAFDKIAMIDSIFGEEKCGHCEGKDIRCSVRKPKNREGRPSPYYELVCQSCGARLDVHQNAPPSEDLYITRKDKEGNVKGKNGWYIWTPADDQNREADQQQQRNQQRNQNRNQNQQPQRGNQDNRTPQQREADFFDFISNKGWTWFDVTQAINKNHGTNYGQATKFSAVDQNFINRFANWLKDQPPKQREPEPAPGGDYSGNIPF